MKNSSASLKRFWKISAIQDFLILTSNMTRGTESLRFLRLIPGREEAITM